MRTLPIFSLALALTACSNFDYTLPEGMVVTETLYSDTDKLFDVCGYGPNGKPALACSFSDYRTVCNIHLPVAANGEAMHRVHEITHCGGREDAPIIGLAL